MKKPRKPSSRTALKRGKVILSKWGTVTCEVCDLDESSARLKFPSFTSLPDEFTLVIAGKRMPVRLAWDQGLQAGVRIAQEPPVSV